MGSPAPNRRDPLQPSDEDRFICIAADDLLAAMTELHSRLIHTGTPRMVAQVLLAEAHVSEAIGLLRSILPKPRAPSAVVCAQPHSPRHAARAAVKPTLKVLNQQRRHVRTA